MRALKAMVWRVIVADSIAESVNRRVADVFIQIAHVAAKSYFRDSLAHLVQQHGVRAIFPTTMYDLPALAELRPELEASGVQVFASSPHLVELLSDKRKMLVAAAKAGLPVL